MPYPIIFSFLFFLVCLGIFIWILTHERRSLRAGVSLVITLFSFAFFGAVVLVNVADLDPHYKDWVLPLFVIVFALIAVGTVTFIITLIVMFLYDGIKIILKEGNRLTNYLSLCMGLAIIFFLFIYPIIGQATKNPWLTYPYVFLWLVIIYLVVIMMMYTLTSWINLINWRVPHLDYIVVLGAGIMGKKVTPLLAARISRGIEIYQENPGSKLIMSGGRGPGEDIPEAEAMAAYAEKLGIPKADIIIENKSRTTKENLQFSHKLMAPNSKFCLVTSSYHVYRALVLAKHQGLKCIGYGAKTKLYFTLNAFVREFIAYLVITKRMQMTVIGFFALMTIIAAAFHF